MLLYETARRRGKTSLRGLRLPVLGVVPVTHASVTPLHDVFALTVDRAARKVRFRSVYPPGAGCAK
jgi:hypothetical protein